jgi:hypothetical protein
MIGLRSHLISEIDKDEEGCIYQLWMFISRIILLKMPVSDIHHNINACSSVFETV